MQSKPLITAGGALAKRFTYSKFRDESLSVLLLDGRYHLVDDCEHALRSAGHRVTRVPVNNDLPKLVRNFLWSALDTKPDFVLSINHIGFDDGGHLGGLLEELSLPAAVWYVDSPGFVLAGAEPPAPSVSTVFCWERAWLPSLSNAGYDDIHWLPLATNASVFLPSGAEQRHDASFVANSMQSALRKWKKKLTPRTHATARKLAGLMLETERELPHRLLGQLAPKLSGKRREDVLAMATWSATAKYRNSLIAASGDSMAVFGDQGWTSIVPPYRYHGPVEYGSKLASVYETTAINVNATSFQMPTAVNQRVFDAPASGGFLLTDEQRDLEELFTPDIDVVTYNSKDDFLSKIDRYRNSSKERQEFIRRARETVLARHTFHHRIERIIQHMRTRHGQLGTAVRSHS